MDLLANLHTVPFVLIQKRLSEIAMDFSLLDESELQRYGQYFDPAKKEEFLAGRCLIKKELGVILGKPATEITLSITENGKPFYKQEGEKQVHFNLSHGSGYFALGLSMNPIGVDLEKKRAVSFEVMQPILSESESRQLAKIPDKERSAQILNLFTAKEAFIKATDKRYGLDEIAFSYLEGDWKLISPDCNCLIQHVVHSDLVIAVSVDPR